MVVAVGGVWPWPSSMNGDPDRLELRGIVSESGYVFVAVKRNGMGDGGRCGART